MTRSETDPEYASCNYCTRMIKCPSNYGTSSMRNHLGRFYASTLRISGSLYVTSNNYFHEVFGIGAMIKKKMSTTDESFKKMAARMKAKYDNATGAKNELDWYLSEQCESLDNKFDLLGWWKKNQAKFPVLASVARDVLAIPASTVASESSFSTGGRILDAFRSSLTPTTVEALICSQNWLRSKNVPIDIEECFEALENCEADVKNLPQAMSALTTSSSQHFPLISLKEIRIHPPASSLLADVSFYSRRSRRNNPLRRRRYHRDTTATLRHPRDAFPTADSELKPLLLRFLPSSLLSDALIRYLPTLICLCCPDVVSSALIRRRHHREGHQPHVPTTSGFYKLLVNAIVVFFKTFSILW
ncbi:hypothetical protein LXL04_014055 [Taraxacum kok-saghyz]